MNLLPYAIGLAVLVLLYIIYDQWNTKREARLRGNIVRVLLFEQVGADKVFRGIIKAHEELDEKLGVYLYLKKRKQAVSGVGQEDYFPDAQLGKCLLVCKYAEDDYRVMERLKEGNWFHEVEKDPLDIYETEEYFDKVTGLNSWRIKEDPKTGEPIRRIENGEPVTDTELVPYIEPLGVRQNAREAQRFNRTFTQRMREKRKEKANFWDKWGTSITSAVMVLVIVIVAVHMINKTTAAAEQMSVRCAENAQEAIQEVRDPLWVEKVFDTMARKNNEEQTPPS
jgi:hypothetical protein